MNMGTISCSYMMEACSPNNIAKQGSHSFTMLCYVSTHYASYINCVWYSYSYSIICCHAAI